MIRVLYLEFNSKPYIKNEYVITDTKGCFIYPRKHTIFHNCSEYNEISCLYVQVFHNYRSEFVRFIQLIDGTMVLYYV